MSTPQPFHRGPSSRWGNPSGLRAHLETSDEAGEIVCCACAANGKATMPAIITMSSRQRIGPRPCCVAPLQGRIFVGDIQEVGCPFRVDFVAEVVEACGEP